VSETPSEYTAQEADAEGVRPLSEAEETDYRERLAYFELNISTSNGQAALDEVLWLAQASRQALATLDAARAELERKDAEAAALRDAAELAYSWMNDWDASRHDETCYGDKPLVRSKLDNTQAGADLLERVRQLEGYLAVCEEQYQAAWVAERRENERLRELLDDANANYEHCVGTNTRLRGRVKAFKELAQEHHTTEGVMRLVAMGSDDNCPICRDHWPQEAPNSSG
jgi:hypothetical protein